MMKSMVGFHMWSSIYLTAIVSATTILYYYNKPDNNPKVHKSF